MNSKNSIILKMIGIAVIIWVLLLPAKMIKELIQERQFRKSSAIEEISSKWGKEQTIGGPILMLPYTQDQVVFTKMGETIDKKTSYLYFLPQTLNIDGTVQTSQLKRGIYESVVYNTVLNISGNFIAPNLDEYNIKTEQVLWNNASLFLGIPDLNGVQDKIELSWNKETYNFKPTVSNKNLTNIEGTVLSAQFPLTGDNHTFSFTLNLNGSESLQFLPLGAQTNVKLSSTWTSPSFVGRFLPDNRQVTDKGFTADWKIIELNREFPQSWKGENSPNLYTSSFGTRFLIMVNEYQKNMRSVKYAILFLSLVFLIFFFIEIINKIRIHPIQYLLVGLSLVLFFSLLISITEHLNFNLAYLISAAATVCLITFYSKFIFKNLKLAILLGLILSFVYAFIYSIMQMEDYSLLLGSSGLFIILAVVMVVSRKINWYETGWENKEEKTLK